LHPGKSVRCSRELTVVGRLDDQAIGVCEPAPNIGDLGDDRGAPIEHLQACHITGYYEVRVLVLLYKANLPRRLGAVEVASSAESPLLGSLIHGAASGIAPAGSVGRGSQS
jgi:hypothetical protein